MAESTHQSQETEKPIGTSIAPQESRPPVAIQPGGVQITDIDGLWRFAKFVVASGFAPKGMERPEAAAIAIEMGLEVGLKPMQAIQNIAVINGRPSIWGDAMKALVESSGLCVSFEERFEGEGDGLTAICEVCRRGRIRPVRWEFGVSDAKRAGLWNKQGPWQQYPNRMLQMRARSFAVRDAFPDVLRGLSCGEESADIIDITPSVDAHRPKASTEVAMAETENDSNEAPVDYGDTAVRRKYYESAVALVGAAWVHERLRADGYSTIGDVPVTIMEEILDAAPDVAERNAIAAEAPESMPPREPKQQPANVVPDDVDF